MLRSETPQPITPAANTRRYRSVRVRTISALAGYGHGRSEPPATDPGGPHQHESMPSHGADMHAQHMRAMRGMAGTGPTVPRSGRRRRPILPTVERHSRPPGKALGHTMPASRRGVTASSLCGSLPTPSVDPLLALGETAAPYVVDPYDSSIPSHSRCPHAPTRVTRLFQPERYWALTV